MMSSSIYIFERRYTYIYERRYIYVVLFTHSNILNGLEFAVLTEWFEHLVASQNINVDLFGKSITLG